MSGIVSGIVTGIVSGIMARYVIIVFGSAIVFRSVFVFVCVCFCFGVNLPGSFKGSSGVRPNVPIIVWFFEVLHIYIYVYAFVHACDFYLII